MINIRTLSILFLTSINFISCSSDSSKTKSITDNNELIECNINDTIFKKLTFGTEKNTYEAFIKKEQNLVFEYLGGKLKCDYSPKFHNNKLFYLEIDLCKLNLFADHFRPSSLNGSMSIEAYAKMQKDNQSRERQADANRIAYGKLLTLYVEKYGKPSNYQKTGKKGELVKGNTDSEFISEYGEFEIEENYTWKCGSREIKINVTLQTNVNANEWKLKSVDELLTNEGYDKLYHDNFKIFYLDHKVETLYNSATKQKGIEMRNKHDSLNALIDNKIKENI